MKLWFPYKDFENAKARESNQMRLNARDIVNLDFGFQFLIIFVLNKFYENRQSKSPHYIYKSFSILTDYASDIKQK